MAYGKRGWISNLRDEFFESSSRTSVMTYSKTSSWTSGFWQFGSRNWPEKSGFEGQTLQQINTYPDTTGTLNEIWKQSTIVFGLCLIHIYQDLKAFLEDIRSRMSQVCQEHQQIFRLWKKE